MKKKRDTSVHKDILYVIQVCITLQMISRLSCLSCGRVNKNCTTCTYEVGVRPADQITHTFIYRTGSVRNQNANIVLLDDTLGSNGRITKAIQFRKCYLYVKMKTFIFYNIARLLRVLLSLSRCTCISKCLVLGQTVLKLHQNSAIL